MDTKDTAIKQAVLENGDNLTIEQASDLLNLKISRLRYMVFTKQIPFFKIGASVLFSKKQLNQWLSTKFVSVGG